MPHIASSAYDLKNQAPAVGAANIAADKIDAHADFCPWSEIMEYRGTGRKIYDGSQTGVPYLHGAVVRQDFAEKYPEIVVAFIESIYDAGQWIKADPMRAVENDGEMVRRREGGSLSLLLEGRPPDSRSDHQAEMDRSPEIRRQRSTEGAGDSAARLQYLDHRPLRQSRLREAWRRLRSPTSPDRRSQGRQSRHADGNLARPRRHRRTIATMDDFLKAVAAYNGTGAKLNATYVYDKNSGLKMFGNSAFYVKAPDGEFAAFLIKPDAEAYAHSVGGTVMTFDQAWNLYATNG